LQTHQQVLSFAHTRYLTLLYREERINALDTAEETWIWPLFHRRALATYSDGIGVRLD
jgi:hypothetical protein